MIRRKRPIAADTGPAVKQLTSTAVGQLMTVTEQSAPSTESTSQTNNAMTKTVPQIKGGSKASWPITNDIVGRMPLSKAKGAASTRIEPTNSTLERGNGSSRAIDVQRKFDLPFSGFGMLDALSGADAVAPMVSDTDLDSEDGTMQASVPSGEASESAPAQPSLPDVQDLAKQVYPILKRMLMVERERVRGL